MKIKKFLKFLFILSFDDELNNIYIKIIKISEIYILIKLNSF